MLSLPGCIVAASCAAASARLPQDAPPLVLHVAPGGDDANSGASSDLAARAEGPLATPERALARLRELSAADPELRARDLEIRLAPGTYELARPLVVDLADVPTLPERRAGIVISGSGARISGGWRVPPLRGSDTAKGPRFVATLDPSRFGGRVPRALFLGTERRTRARHPDAGCHEVAELHPEDAAKPWNSGVRNLRAAPDTLLPFAAAADPTAIDFTLLCRWIESHCRARRIDAVTGEVELLDPTVFKLDPGDLWYAEGEGALDAPGEWWIDAATGSLSIVPAKGERLDEAGRIVAAGADGGAALVLPRLERLLTVAGDAERATDRAFVIAGVTFEHAAWWYPGDDAAAPRASGSPQAAIDVPAAVVLEGVRDAVIERCEITACDTYGISIGRGSRDVTLSSCSLSNLGGGGIKIGETALPRAPAELTRDVRVGRNTLRGLGRVFHSAIGIWVGQSSSLWIERNRISDLHYSAISLGWTWGYGDSAARDILVRDNEIARVGRQADGSPPLLSDLGGIYTLGAQPGTVIEHNRFTAIEARRYGGWGIYFDEGSTGIEARFNEVRDTSHGGFHQHYGRDNSVHHNLFAAGRDAQLQRTRVEPHVSFRFEQNVIVWRGGEVFSGSFEDAGALCERNVWVVEDAASARWGGRAFSEWQAAGRERGSRLHVEPRALARLESADAGYLADGEFGWAEGPLAAWPFGAPEDPAFALFSGTHPGPRSRRD